MTNYAVELTDAALAAIAEQAYYITVEVQAPLNAERWLGRIWDAVDSLEQLPQRAGLARDFGIRLICGFASSCPIVGSRVGRSGSSRLRRGLGPTSYLDVSVVRSGSCTWPP